jgi:hypothetical protein
MDRFRRAKGSEVISPKTAASQKHLIDRQMEPRWGPRPGQRRHRGDSAGEPSRPPRYEPETAGRHRPGSGKRVQGTGNHTSGNDDAAIRKAQRPPRRALPARAARRSRRRFRHEPGRREEQRGRGKFRRAAGASAVITQRRDPSAPCRIRPSSTRSRSTTQESSATATSDLGEKGRGAAARRPRERTQRRVDSKNDPSNPKSTEK